MENPQSQTTDKTLAETLERLKKLEESVQTLQRRLEQYETKQPPNGEEKPENHEESKKPTQQAILEIDLMNLPDSLRKTMLAIAKHGETTPEGLAEETRRTRGLENIYLNELERLGYVEKFKKGKRVYFRSLRTT